MRSMAKEEVEDPTGHKKHNEGQVVHRTLMCES